ncbi:hypothetical protein M595_0337 [Lyngbya aestuarii BL J]|uniref:Uncharacterized protein n=1 Tax=Lyngbya aestuarii BL J TaxID=1348334 RepID=U7QP96_9CYAN|nr:hypothetical protein M595_0337 [Lyngbya aestuarii BL J]
MVVTAQNVNMGFYFYAYSDSNSICSATRVRYFNVARVGS